MSTTRYKIRLWEYDGEASVANAVTFDSFDEAQARFNDLRVSEEMPCVEFIKERIANGCIIGDEVLNVRQFTSVFDAITKDKPTLAGFLRSLPVIEAPWDGAFQERFCVECGADSCDDCPNEQFRNNPEWWLPRHGAGGYRSALSVQRLRSRISRERGIRPSCGGRADAIPRGAGRRRKRRAGASGGILLLHGRRAAQSLHNGMEKYGLLRLDA